MPQETDGLNLKREIKKSKRYLRILDSFETLAVWDVDVYHDEVLKYQEGRGNREPHALKNSPKRKIVEYASEDAALRSRITHIQIMSRKLSYRLEFLIDVLRDWVLSEYSSKLKGTVQIKNAFINDLAVEFLSFNSRLNALDDCCRLILEDIDQSQWSRKAVISVLEINARPEGKV